MEVLTTLGFKKIKQLRIGDEVVAADLKTVNKIEEINVWTSKNTEKANHGEFIYYHINDNLKFYKEQSIYANGRVVHARELKIGDKIFDHNRSEVTIYSIKKSYGHIWHKFKVSGDHSYIVKGAILHNAARFWVGGGTNTNWNSSPTTNWAASSGGAGNQTAPGIADDVTLDGAGASGNTASVISATQSVLSLTFTSGYTQSVTVNGALTIAGNFTDNTAHSWAGSSAMTISAASTITSGGKTWPNNVTFSNANTKTLSGNWTITGTLSITGTTTLNWTTNEVLSIGGLTVSVAAISGTASITLTGGTWSGAQIVQNSLTIAGNVTMTGSNTYNTGTLTYVSGTVTTTGSTLTIGASTTLNTNGITFNNIILSSSETITINSLLSVTGTLTINTLINITFAGTAGFTVATLTCSGTTATTITFVNNVTYTITTAFNAFQSKASTLLLFTSDHASNRANLVLQSDATTCNVLASFTRINASAGRPINSFNGTITDSPNVYAYTNVLFKPPTSFNRGARRSQLTNKNKAVMYQ